MIFKVPLSGGGLSLLLSFPQALNTELSPLERWPSRISMSRPQMESRPYEFLLHPPWGQGHLHGEQQCPEWPLLILKPGVTRKVREI